MGFKRLNNDLPGKEVMELLQRSLCRFMKVDLFQMGSDSAADPATHTGHLDKGGETPEQKDAKIKAEEEAKWREVEGFLAQRAALRDDDDDAPAGGIDEAEIEKEALESQQELDGLFKE